MSLFACFSGLACVAEVKAVSLLALELCLRPIIGMGASWGHNIVHASNFGLRESDVEEAKRRLARFDWQLEQQRQSLKRLDSSGHQQDGVSIFPA